MASPSNPQTECYFFNMDPHQDSYQLQLTLTDSHSKVPGITFDQPLSFGLHVHSQCTKFFPRFKALHSIALWGLSKKSVPLSVLQSFYPFRYFISLTTVVPPPQQYTGKRFGSSSQQYLQNTFWLSLLHSCPTATLRITPFPAGDHANSPRTFLWMNLLPLKGQFSPEKVYLQSNPSQIEEKTLLAIFLLLLGNTRSQRTPDFILSSLGSTKLHCDHIHWRLLLFRPWSTWCCSWLSPMTSQESPLPK